MRPLCAGRGMDAKGGDAAVLTHRLAPFLYFQRGTNSRTLSHGVALDAGSTTQCPTGHIRNRHRRVSLDTPPLELVSDFGSGFLFSRWPLYNSIRCCEQPPSPHFDCNHPNNYKGREGGARVPEKTGPRVAPHFPFCMSFLQNWNPEEVFDEHAETFFSVLQSISGVAPGYVNYHMAPYLSYKKESNNNNNNDKEES